jgi:hypothetical protein
MHRKRMNLQQQEQFYQVMTRLRGNSRAASLPEAEIRVTEMDSNGVLINKPMKWKRSLKPKQLQLKTHGFGDLHPRAQFSNKRARLLQGINKLKAIQDFIHSNGRI